MNTHSVRVRRTKVQTNRQQEHRLPILPDAISVVGSLTTHRRRQPALLVLLPQPSRQPRPRYRSHHHSHQSPPLPLPLHHHRRPRPAQPAPAAEEPSTFRPVARAPRAAPCRPQARASGDFWSSGASGSPPRCPSTWRQRGPRPGVGSYYQVG